MRKAKRPEPSDPSDIFVALNRGGVQYLAIGGIAAIAHGVPRTTFDVDLAVRLETANLERLAAVMRRLEFEPRVPANVVRLADPKTRQMWTRQKMMKVFSFIERQAPFRVVDVMVRPLPRFEQLYSRRLQVRYGRVNVPVVPVEELIRMKSGTGRLRDQEDVEFLRAVRRLSRP